MIWIDSRAFANCSSLETVKIGKTVRRIGYSAFFNCNNLKSITLENAPQGIPDAFPKCNSLTAIYYKGTISQWNSIVKEDCGIFVPIEWNHFIPNVTVYCIDGTI